VMGCLRLRPNFLGVNHEIQVPIEFGGMGIVLRRRWRDRSPGVLIRWRCFPVHAKHASVTLNTSKTRR